MDLLSADQAARTSISTSSASRRSLGRPPSRPTGRAEWLFDQRDLDRALGQPLLPTAVSTSAPGTSSGAASSP